MLGFKLVLVTWLEKVVQELDDTEGFPVGDGDSTVVVPDGTWVLTEEPLAPDDV